MAGRIAYYGNTVTNGLVLSLDAAKRDSYPGSGTAWRDISGNGNNGTLTNGPTFNSDNGGSIVFDGVDDFVSTNKQFFTGTDNFTITTWLKSNGTQNQYSVPISQGHYPVIANQNTGFAFQIGFPSLTDMTFILGDGTTTWRSVSFSYTPNTDTTWTFLSVTKNSNTFITYKNGIFVASGTHTISYGTYNFTIGKDSYNIDSNSRSWIGRIASTQIYNRALSATEILQNYNAVKSRYGL
jgi:hypothetical protein